MGEESNEEFFYHGGVKWYSRIPQKSPLPNETTNQRGFA